MLVHETQWPDYRPPAEKALCVVVRDFGGPFTAFYLDTEYVGGTESHTVLSFPVSPGEHFIYSDSRFNRSLVKFNFRAGKTYYLRQAIPFSPVFISVISPLTGSEAATLLQKEKDNVEWVKPNPAKLLSNLDADRMDDFRKDYEEWGAKAENADSYKIEKEYPGY